MSCYKSYIYFRFNTEPEESICVGMIMLDKETGQAKAKLSEAKLNLASKILPKNGVFDNFKYSVSKLVKYDQIDYNFLDWQNRYQNGMIKVTKPSIIACSLERFDSLFESSIERNIKKK